MFDRAGFDCLGGHSENNGGGFVLCDDNSAGVLDSLCAIGSVIAHAGKNCGDGHRPGKSGDGFESDVNIGQIAVEAAGGAVELNASGWRNAQMLATRADVECSGLENIVCSGFFDADSGKFFKLSGVLRRECRGHVLDQNHGSREVFCETGREAHHSCRAAGGRREHDDGEPLIGHAAWRRNAWRGRFRGGACVTIAGLQSRGEPRGGAHDANFRSHADFPQQLILDAVHVEVNGPGRFRNKFDGAKFKSF